MALVRTPSSLSPQLVNRHVWGVGERGIPSCTNYLHFLLTRTWLHLTAIWWRRMAQIPCYSPHNPSQVRLIEFGLSLPLLWIWPLYVSSGPQIKSYQCLRLASLGTFNPTLWRISFSDTVQPSKCYVYALSNHVANIAHDSPTAYKILTTAQSG